ncbi:MAG TPA: class B sortase, partial [Syntrophomonas sp.]|nr:class B sortase [Syntrophomonas sp.]
MKHLRKSNLQRILHILMTMCAAGILYSAFILFACSREYDEGNAVYQQIRQMMESPAPSATRASQFPKTAGKVPAEEKRDLPAASIDFLSLEKINPDVVGWLAVEGAGIDYPVVQGKDNDYYLQHLFTGERNKLGSIFMDYSNHSDFSDRNTIIYGHNMQNGSMFSSLAKYKKQSYYDSFPAMVLYTPRGNYKIHLFAGIIVDGNDRSSIRLNFKDDQEFQAYIKLLKKDST